MGVAGSGKTRIGRLLAQKIEWPFFDGDDFHSAPNVEKMSRGVPLTDEDRKNWLGAIRARMDSEIKSGGKAIVACSALREIYREKLGVNRPEVMVVHLKGDKKLLFRRLAERKAHFFPPELLESQLKILEEPQDVLTVDIRQEEAVIVEKIRNAMFRE